MGRGIPKKSGGEEVGEVKERKSKEVRSGCSASEYIMNLDIESGSYTNNAKLFTAIKIKTLKEEGKYNNILQRHPPLHPLSSTS